MTSPTQVRIDSEVKAKASKLFKELGLDMSSAVNLFLHQCVLRGGLPFSVEKPKKFSKETIAAIKEAEEIMKNGNKKGYKEVEELFKALNED